MFGCCSHVGRAVLMSLDDVRGCIIDEGVVCELYREVLAESFTLVVVLTCGVCTSCCSMFEVGDSLS